MVLKESHMKKKEDGRNGPPSLIGVCCLRLLSFLDEIDEIGIAEIESIGELTRDERSARESCGSAIDDIKRIDIDRGSEAKIIHHDERCGCGDIRAFNDSHVIKVSTNLLALSRHAVFEENEVLFFEQSHDIRSDEDSGRFEIFIFILDDELCFRGENSIIDVVKRKGCAKGLAIGRGLHLGDCGFIVLIGDSDRILDNLIANHICRNSCEIDMRKSVCNLEAVKHRDIGAGGAFAVAIAPCDVGSGQSRGDACGGSLVVIQ